MKSNETIRQSTHEHSSVVLWTRILTLVATFLIYHLTAIAQLKTEVVDSTATTRTVVAGDYMRTGAHNMLFGKHYRREWNTPVKVKIAWLDTLAGGVKPYEVGGGRQSKSLKLHDKNDREYVLRSIDKTYTQALPEIYRGTFLENIINDQISAAHPYSAFTIPIMAEAAGIYHTNPQLLFLPEQQALDTFNKKFSKTLYLFEQRPDEDWRTAKNFGYSKNIVSTEKMIEELLEDNSNQVDQLAYVRCRLFDMFIGDWGRHEDQWRWASLKKGKQTFFQPIPRDRDQTYTKYEGFLTGILLSAANMDNLQTFDYDIKKIKDYNFSARYLDRLLTNETTIDQWVDIAEDLQTRLTDEIVESSVRQMPQEAFAISGGDIIAKLKSRRQHLVEFANNYYKFLARHVDIPGSEKKEYFEVNRINDHETSVRIFRLNANREDTPFYSRTFNTEETKDVRLYGVDNNDIFIISGNVDRGIKVRIIGGPDKDSVIDNSYVSRGSKRSKVYDDEANIFQTGKETKLLLDDDTSVHSYDYNEFAYHKRGIKPTVSYTTPDKLYAGIGYEFKRHQWRKDPYGFEQGIYLRYSIAQGAFSILYSGTFYQLIGNWNLKVNASQDFIRWTNFFGLGNETPRIDTVDISYYRARTNEFIGAVGLNRIFNSVHHIDLDVFLQGVEVINDPNHFLAQEYTPQQLDYYHHRKYVGANVGYTYQDVNDRVLPTKGLMFYAGATFSENFGEYYKRIFTYNSILHAFIPIRGKFSISSRIGFASVDGDPEFYQYTSIGGSQKMRGFRRDRYWGKTSIYNRNELRWITDFRNPAMNGKIGLVAVLDNGRVWMPGEVSHLWHLGYGGGFLLCPFNKITLSVVYAASDDDQRFHVTVLKLLKR